MYHMNKKLLCEICGHLFKSYCGLKVHQISIHFGKQYFCNICNYQSKYIHELYRHKKAIHSKFRFICKCGKSYSYRRSLTQHQRLENHF